MRREIKFYLSIVLHRLPLVLLVSGTLSGAVVVFALLQPSLYRANALLLVEAPQIPTNLAASTVATGAPEQLDIIQQRLLTRANLLEIANKHNVYPDRSSISPDEVVERMRDNTRFFPSFGQNRATNLEVTFTSEIPEVTAAVVSDYITRVLDENVALRTGIAENTLAFFEQEVARLGEELDRQSARILEFKNANIDALPESMEYRLGRQSMLLERRASLQRDKSGLEDQHERLVQIFEATGQSGSAAPQTPEQQRLDGLNDQLSQALAIYTEQNPRVKLLRTQIKSLEAEIARSAGASRGQPISDISANEAILSLQLADIDSRIENLNEQIEQIDRELAVLEDSIARTPANAITLEALQRDYDNISMRYKSETDRLATAATGERIELTAKGQRITVLQQPVVPRKPFRPNRTRIIASGVAASLGAAIGLVVLLEFLNKTVRRPADLTRALGITPLATVPYITSTGETAKRRGLVIAAVAAIAIGIPAGLYYIHVEYLPLDLIADRAMARLGL